MEVKMDQILKTLDGKPIPASDSPLLKDDKGNYILNPDGKGMFDPKFIKGLTLGDACVIALQAQFEDERNLAGDKKMERWKLAQRIYGVSKIDLKAEEITLLKELVAKGWGITVVGQACDMLDPVKK